MDFEQLIELHDRDYRADQSNRERAIDDLSVLEGSGQWHEEDRQRRRAEGQPTVTVNRLNQFVRNVVGEVRNTNPSFSITPMSDDDKELTDIIGGHIKHIVNRSSRDKPVLTAFEGAVSANIGHFRVNTKYCSGNPFNQDIYLEAIPNPLAVTWDAGARSITRSDANHCWVHDKITKSEFKRRFPNADLQSFTSNDLYKTSGWFFESKDDFINIAEFWQKTQYKAEFALMESGDVLQLDRLPAGWIHMRDEGVIIDDVGTINNIEEVQEADADKITVTILNGVEVLEKNDWAGRYIPIIPVLGDQVITPDYAHRFSLHHWGIGPQRLYNYHKSVQAGILRRSMESPIAIPLSQASDDLAADIVKSIETAQPFFIFDDTKNPNPPQRIQGTAIDPALTQAALQSADDMKAAIGIYDAGLGNRSNETSGVAIRARQIESQISSNVFSDNLRASLELAGQVIVDLMPIIYDTERTLKILNEDGTVGSKRINSIESKNDIRLMYNNISKGQYDISVKMGANYSSQRSEALDLVSDVLRNAPQLSGQFFDLVMELADVPNSQAFVKRAKKLLPPELQESENDSSDNNQALAIQQQLMQQNQEARNIELQMAGLEAEKAALVAQKASFDAEKAKYQSEKEELELVQKRLEALRYVP